MTLVHPARQVNVSLQGKTRQPIDIKNIEEQTLPNNFDIGFYETKNNNFNYNVSLISDVPYHKKAGVTEVLNAIYSMGTKNCNENDWNNFKAENNITKDMKVMFDTEDDNELIVKMLKLQDNLVNEPLGIKAYKVFSNRIKAQIFFEKIETEADIAQKEAQIEQLKSSIARREKLLSNENYVNKAPTNIVEMDRQKLEEEKQKLAELTK